MPQPLFDENATCDRCGKHGAHRFDGAALCDDCYASGGSCCAGPETKATDATAEPEQGN